MKLYMKCTTDKYELPLIVEDSVTILAQKLGLTVGSVASMVSRNRCGYHKVEIDNLEMED